MPGGRSSRPHCLKRFEGLAALLSTAHAQLAAAALQQPSTPVSARAVDAEAAGDTPGGDALLLRYWLRLLRADLDARLAAVRARGFAAEARGVLQNSLVVRLMQVGGWVGAWVCRAPCVCRWWWRWWGRGAGCLRGMSPG